jgi:hypothetical protein
LLRLPQGAKLHKKPSVFLAAVTEISPALPPGDFFLAKARKFVL